MPSFDVLLISALLGYLLGSIPVAYQVSRRRGVDIFARGTGLPGAANVYRAVGHKSGALVFAGDVAKGSLAIIVADRLGLDDVWVLLPGAAAIAGHWRSVFTRFRGGDGLLTVVGITVVAMPTFGLLTVAIGFIVGIWSRHGTYPTLYGGVTCYSLLLALSIFYQTNVLLGSGVVTLALMVLAHAVIGHRRRGMAHADLAA